MNDKKSSVSGIYKIINKINGKYYVGSSDNILGTTGRWKEHINGLKNNRHDNKYLQNAWNKYGESNFEFIIIEEIPKEKLFEIEQKYLDKLKLNRRNLCYNLSFNATGGGFLGHRHSMESRRKISEKLKGKPSPTKGLKQSQEQINHRVVNYLIGDKNARWKHVNEETKAKLFIVYKQFGSVKMKLEASKYGFGNSVWRKLAKEFKKL